MTTLTDRYVDATVRRLPGPQRTDIEQELGDPARLAARYASVRPSG